MGSPSQGLKFEDIPNGLAALDVTPVAGLVQIAVLVGVHELLVKQRPGKKPGDFGTGYFGVALDDESSYQLQKLNVEIQNGRLAMLGILGMFASEIIHKGTLHRSYGIAVIILTLLHFWSLPFHAYLLCTLFSLCQIYVKVLNFNSKI